MDFKLSLIQKLLECHGNNHTDNWDEFRFGKETKLNSSRFIPKISCMLNRKGYTHFVQTKQLLYYTDYILTNFWKYLESTYDLLEDQKSKKIYVEVIAHKILGYKKVKLESNNFQRLELINEIKKFRDREKSLQSNFKNEKLYLFKFSYNKHIISFYTRSPLNTFFLRQYHLDKKIIPEKGDIVIDCGACWGDTPLEFGSTIGEKGFVYAFEFIPRNIEIIKINLDLNRSISSRIKIMKNAVWSESNKNVYYMDQGPGSTVKFEKFDGYQGVCKSLSIDDLVQKENMSKVDFIKMDIEGAEPKALLGAINTIKRFKPKLAISIYHNLNDYSQIATWIDNLRQGYRFYIRHYTIHAEETVLYAKVVE